MEKDIQNNDSNKTKDNIVNLDKLIIEDKVSFSI